MKIGIVGLGVVGSAVRYGFEKLGHTVGYHDIKYNTSLDDVVDTEVCYICVPTPTRGEGECDVSIVREVVLELNSREYKGVVAIKSTVAPGTTRSLQESFPNLDLCFVPEFLRERCPEVDFMENHDLCIIGTDSDEVFNIIKKCHGKYPKVFKQMSSVEAELSKYFNNIFNATLIIFANSFYEVCQRLGADYASVKDAMTIRSHIPDLYLDCNESFRGFGGMCLPKDTKAIAALCENMHLDIEFFKMLLKENSKYKITVFTGMRKE